MKLLKEPSFFGGEGVNACLGASQLLFVVFMYVGKGVREQSDLFFFFSFVRCFTSTLFLLCVFFLEFSIYSAHSPLCFFLYFFLIHPFIQPLLPCKHTHTKRSFTHALMEKDVNAERTNIEVAAEQVTEAKHLLVELDRRKNQYREAQRKILNNRPEEDLWVLSGGSTFVSCELSHADTLKYFEWRLQQCDNEIEEAREDLKLKVAALAELEGPDSALNRLYEGFSLKAMS